MNVLLTNNHCSFFGGTENYIVDLARALKIKEYNVSIYIHLMQDQMLSQRYFHKKYPDITWYISQLPLNNFNLLLINHNSCLQVFKNYQGRKIFTTHGYPDIEQPIKGLFDELICISPELMKKNTRFLKKKVIRNGFFIDEYEYYYDDKSKITRALLVDYYCISEQVEFFKNICQKKGIHGEVFSQKNLDPIGIRNLLRDYDLIMTTGRTALEAIFLGKKVIIFSTKFGCNGLLTEKTLSNISYYNYSGRSSEKVDLDESIEKSKILSQKDHRNLYTILRSQHNIFQCLEQYLIKEDN